MAVLLSPKVWIALALAAVLAFTHLFVYRAGKATVRTDFDAYKLEVADAAAKSADLARKEGERRQSEFNAAADAARQENTRLQADAVRLAAARDGLSNDIATLRKRLANSAKPADGGASQPSDDAIGVLARVYDRADTEAGVVAQYADRLRIAGLACEKSVDQMSTEAIN